MDDLNIKSLEVCNMQLGNYPDLNQSPLMAIFQADTNLKLGLTWAQVALSQTLRAAPA